MPLALSYQHRLLNLRSFAIPPLAQTNFIMCKEGYEVLELIGKVLGLRVLAWRVKLWISVRHYAFLKLPNLNYDQRI